MSPGGSGRAGLSGDCITLQRLESGAGFAPTILSMLGRGLGNYLHHWLHSNYSGKKITCNRCLLARKCIMLDVIVFEWSGR